MTAAASNTGILKTRKVTRITIQEDSCGDWRITLHFDKGRCRKLGETYDSHHGAALAASGIPTVQNWVPPLEGFSK